MTAEHHRTISINRITPLKTWRNCWPTWRSEILKYTDNLSNPQKIHALGGQLREIFLATNTGSRDQGALSGGGTGWECLVTWYLNLVFSGTNAVAMRQSKSLVPSTLLDATTINYGSNQTNTESDICIIIYPDDFDFPEVNKNFIRNVDKELSTRIRDIELGIIQCKTNWNDNAQIPMLWDMIYRAKDFRSNNIHIGRNGYSVGRLHKFTYSFVTAPTQKPGKMPNNSSQMAVKRVANLSGGNYWGMPSKSGVALSLSEIFERNFSSAFKEDIRSSINNAMKRKIGLHRT